MEDWHIKQTGETHLIDVGDKKSPVTTSFEFSKELVLLLLKRQLIRLVSSKDVPVTVTAVPPAIGPELGNIDNTETDATNSKEELLSQKSSPLLEIEIFNKLLLPLSAACCIIVGEMQ